LDIVDRLEIKHLALENFWRYIVKSEVPLEEPSHLSSVTVAKAIEYGVSLLGFFIEAYVGYKQELGKEADFPRLSKAEPNRTERVSHKANASTLQSLCSRKLALEDIPEKGLSGITIPALFDRIIIGPTRGARWFS
jgi:hypothetical protein